MFFGSAHNLPKHSECFYGHFGDTLLVSAREDSSRGRVSTTNFFHLYCVDVIIKLLYITRIINWYKGSSTLWHYH
ncbi:hypothetical protein AC249_AIPGENE5253 [Exaiptasia diaphana]|nr:hypothetical protein AC249_AIPGENE5253 [Exaiptasia diaphana]